MRFQMSTQFEEGVADVDPVAAPQNILTEHMGTPDKYAPEDPDALFLALLGTAAETVTLDLYLLIESKEPAAQPSEYVEAGTRWFRFATGIVVTNGTLQKVEADLPAGGIVYARRTADSITAGQTRSLLMSWVHAKQ